MIKFNIGDKVKVTKPDDLMEGPHWVPEAMDSADGNICTIRSVGSNYLSLEGHYMSWDPRWMTLVNTLTSNNKLLLLEKRSTHVIQV